MFDAGQQRLQRRARPRPVLDIGCCHDDQQYQAQRIHRDMLFVASHFLAGIIAAFGSALNGPHALTIENRCTRLTEMLRRKKRFSA